MNEHYAHNKVAYSTKSWMIIPLHTTSAMIDTITQLIWRTIYLLYRGRFSDYFEYYVVAKSTICTQHIQWMHKSTTPLYVLCIWKDMSLKSLSLKCINISIYNKFAKLSIHKYFQK